MTESMNAEADAGAEFQQASRRIPETADVVDRYVDLSQYLVASHAEGQSTLGERNFSSRAL